MKPVVLVHGGAAAPAKFVDGAEAAARVGMQKITTPDQTPLAAAAAAAILMEDDPRFNAGTGSNLRLDGKTIEMDAAVMTSEGEFGAVMALQRTKNPILVAEAVLKTPHLMVAGEGALRLARKLGLPDYDPLTPRAVEKYARAMEKLKAARKGADYHDGHQPWIDFDPEEWWNFPDDLRAGDTIGAVVRDAAGRFAVANSTGGTSTMLYGRVGDSPILGAGLYAGPFGAAAATGEGEEIVKRLSCYRIHERLAAGATAAEAGQAAIAEFPERVVVGFIVAGLKDAWGGSNREMPFAILEGTE